MYRAIVISTCDDWEGLYIDGVLTTECVSFFDTESGKLLSALMRKHDIEGGVIRRTLEDADKKLIVDGSGFPITITELNGSYV